jgi:prolyl-tRNA synthetase
VEAESGPIGGDASHEFMAPAPNGEDFVVRCPGCSYAANQERADTGRSVEIPTKTDAVDPQLVDTPNAGSIEEVSKLLKSEASGFIKTLIYIADDKPVAVLVRGDHDANEGKIRRALGAVTLELANDATVERVTGAPVGFAGPVGLECNIIADHDIAKMSTAVTGANSNDQHLTDVIPGTHFDLSDTYDLRNAAAGDPCPKCEAALEIVHGIEVGHVFKLGTKYSESLNANYLDADEKKHPIIMGCYGIGVTRVVAAIVETCHDNGGIVWPEAVAPYTVEIIPLNVTDETVMNTATKIYDQLTAAGVDVLMDDRDQRPGFKFKDADLIGLPYRMIVGGKGLKDGIVEIKRRTDQEAERVPIAEAVGHVTRLINVK